MGWLKDTSIGSKLRHRAGCLLHKRRHSMQSLKREQLPVWQDGQECKSDVKVLLHFRSANCWYSSRKTPFFGVDDVRVLLQRKKIRKRQFECNRSNEDSICCRARCYEANEQARVAVMLQCGVRVFARVVRFSRAPRRFLRPRLYTIATRENFPACAFGSVVLVSGWDTPT